MEAGFRIKARLLAEPGAVCRAWRPSQPGGRFTPRNGYILGRNVEAKPRWCIIQARRTADFAASHPDSRRERCTHPTGNGSEILLIHTGIPPAQVAGYKSGWVEHYFKPRKAYFSTKTPAPTPVKKTAAKKKVAKKSGRKKATKKKPERKNGHTGARLSH